MENQSKETVRDYIVDRIHELVDDERLEDAISLYEEYKETFINVSNVS
jgi:hypothetical protein|tara:strand:+ start:590 stop:733 length:144 start_codon:yes stop_codon:yes gene_type:complete